MTYTKCVLFTSGPCLTLSKCLYYFGITLLHHPTDAAKPSSHYISFPEFRRDLVPAEWYCSGIVRGARRFEPRGRHISGDRVRSISRRSYIRFELAVARWKRNSILSPNRGSELLFLCTLRRKFIFKIYGTVAHAAGQQSGLRPGGCRLSTVWQFTSLANALDLRGRVHWIDS